MSSLKNKPSKMLVLGIETSCDETSAAVIEANESKHMVRLLSNAVSSSLSLHAKTGGIIPEVAAREQIKYILSVIDKALEESLQSTDYSLQSKSAVDRRQLAVDRLDSIAVTVGPGLIGSLLVGVETAKTLAFVWNKPIIPVNHLIGHIYANWINQSSDYRPQTTAVDRRRWSVDHIEFPAIALIVSGGHTDLVLMRNHGSIKWLGGTRDDAAGEAFDKIGRLLGLPYPAGPVIEKLSERGDASRFTFPRPMIDSNDFDFSFSGLKTAVFREIKAIEQPARPAGGLSNETIADLSASVQQAIIDVLVKKTLKAAQKYQVKSILLSGGVAANQKLREQFSLEIRNLKLEIPLSVPPPYLCTDNGAMIASAAFFNYKPLPWQKITTNPELYFD